MIEFLVFLKRFQIIPFSGMRGISSLAGFGQFAELCYAKSNDKWSLVINILYF